MLNNYRARTLTFTDLLIFGIVLLAMRLYTLFIPYSTAKAVVMLGEIIVLAFLIVHIVYDKETHVPMRYRWLLGIILLSLILATFASKVYHNQGFLDSIISQYDFYFFLFYFLLHYLRPDPRKLLSMFLIFGYVYFFIYITQFFVYPKVIVNSRILAERGTIRIFMPGLPFLFTSFFLLLGRFFITKRIRYILMLLPLASIFIILGSRQLLATVVLLTMINILLSRTIKSKLLTYIMIFLCIVPVFFMFEGILNELLKTSQRQFAVGLAENIRFQAAYFFLADFNTNFIWMLTGNGAPGSHSHYGDYIRMLNENFGFYLEDIGLIGDFVKFGVLFVIGQVLFLIKLLRTKLYEEYTFIRYNVMSIMLTMFSGSGLHSSVIALICMMMYIADVVEHDIILKSRKKAPAPI